MTQQKDLLLFFIAIIVVPLSSFATDESFPDCDCEGTNESQIKLCDDLPADTNITAACNVSRAIRVTCNQDECSCSCRITKYDVYFNPNSSFICDGSNSMYSKPCELNFHVDHGMFLALNGPSTLAAGTIRLSIGNLTIGSQGVVNATARGLRTRVASRALLDGHGGSNGGYGGARSCDTPETHTIEQIQNPVYPWTGWESYTESWYGHGGCSSDTSLFTRCTCGGRGGGRVYIQADHFVTLNKDSRIVANGEPSRYQRESARPWNLWGSDSNCGAGSGGSVLINATDIIANSAIISASGGSGLLVGGPGSSISSTSLKNSFAMGPIVNRDNYGEKDVQNNQYTMHHIKPQPWQPENLSSVSNFVSPDQVSRHPDQNQQSSSQAFGSGGGGRVSLIITNADNSLDGVLVDVSGGSVSNDESSCLRGAAGIVLSAVRESSVFANVSYLGEVLVSNCAPVGPCDSEFANAVTPLTVSHVDVSGTGTRTPVLIGSLQITKFASVVSNEILLTHKGSLLGPQNGITLSSSQLSLIHDKERTSNKVTIRAGGLELRESSKLYVSTSSTLVDSLEASVELLGEMGFLLSPKSKVQFQGYLNITSFVGNLTIDGSIQQPAAPTGIGMAGSQLSILVLQSESVINMRESAVVLADQIVVMSNTQLNISSSRVEATHRPHCGSRHSVNVCRQIRSKGFEYHGKTEMQNLIGNYSLVFATTRSAARNKFHKTSIHDMYIGTTAGVSSPSIALCGDRVMVEGELQSTSAGCISDMGTGRGCQAKLDTGGGAGGAGYGGQGGFGTGCENPATSGEPNGSPFGDWRHPEFAGSGGGSGSHGLSGGSGGGVIVIDADIVLWFGASSVVASDGGSGAQPSSVRDARDVKYLDMDRQSATSPHDSIVNVQQQGYSVHQPQPVNSVHHRQLEYTVNSDHHRQLEYTVNSGQQQHDRDSVRVQRTNHQPNSISGGGGGGSGGSLNLRSYRFCAVSKYAPQTPPPDSLDLFPHVDGKSDESMVLVSQARISASGGKAGSFDAGGGGGGRVGIFLGSEKNSVTYHDASRVQPLLNPQDGFIYKQSCTSWGNLTLPVAVQGGRYTGPGNVRSYSRSHVGENGTIKSPVCLPGSGGSWCMTCKKGTYKQTHGMGVCLQCKEQDCIHKGTCTWLVEGFTSPHCPVLCIAGYVQPFCVTPLERFVDSLGGLEACLGLLGGLVLIVVILFTCICTQVSGCPGYTSERRRIGREHREKVEALYEQRLRAGVLQTLSAPLLGPRTASPRDPEVSRNLLSRLDSDQSTSAVGRLSDDETRGQMGYDVGSLEALEPLGERVVSTAMSERDLKFHCARIYFTGNNTFDRPWKLPSKPPRSIASIVDEDEYYAMAKLVNTLCAYDDSQCPDFAEDISLKRRGPVLWLWGAISEHTVYQILRWLCFPVAKIFYDARRKARAEALLDFFSQYDNRCIKSTRAQQLRNGIKFSTDISSCSNGYIDVLYDRDVTRAPSSQSDSFHTVTQAPTSQSDSFRTGGDASPSSNSLSVQRPLTSPLRTESEQMSGLPPHQGISLPLVLAISGDGSYWHRFYLDTTDVLVKAVPNTIQLRTFIDRDWVNLLHGINTCLRMVKRNRLRTTIEPLLELLEDHNTDSMRRGGLRVQFGLFWPNLEPNNPDSDTNSVGGGSEQSGGDSSFPIRDLMEHSNLEAVSFSALTKRYHSRRRSSDVVHDGSQTSRRLFRHHSSGRSSTVLSVADDGNTDDSVSISIQGTHNESTQCGTLKDMKLGILVTTHEVNTNQNRHHTPTSLDHHQQTTAAVDQTSISSHSPSISHSTQHKQSTSVAAQSPKRMVGKEWNSEAVASFEEEMRIARERKQQLMKDLSANDSNTFKVPASHRGYDFLGTPPPTSGRKQRTENSPISVAEAIAEAISHAGERSLLSDTQDLKLPKPIASGQTDIVGKSRTGSIASQFGTSVQSIASVDHTETQPDVSQEPQGTHSRWQRQHSVIREQALTAGTSENPNGELEDRSILPLLVSTSTGSAFSSNQGSPKKLPTGVSSPRVTGLSSLDAIQASSFVQHDPFDTNLDELSQEANQEVDSHVIPPPVSHWEGQDYVSGTGSEMQYSVDMKLPYPGVLLTPLGFWDPYTQQSLVGKAAAVASRHGFTYHTLLVPKQELEVLRSQQLFQPSLSEYRDALFGSQWFQHLLFRYPDVSSFKAFTYSVQQRLGLLVNRLPPYDASVFWVQPVVRACLIVLVCLDVTLTFMVLVNLTCIDVSFGPKSLPEPNDAISSTVHCSPVGFWVTFLVYPFAPIVAPVLGFTLGVFPLSGIGRHYASWNLLSMINTAVACTISILPIFVFSGTGRICAFSMLLCKVLQSYLVDYFVAMVETNRGRHRGWK